MQLPNMHPLSRAAPDVDLGPQLNLKALPRITPLRPATPSLSSLSLSSAPTTFPRLIPASRATSATHSDQRRAWERACSRLMPLRRASRQCGSAGHQWSRYHRHVSITLAEHQVHCHHNGTTSQNQGSLVSQTQGLAAAAAASCWSSCVPTPNILHEVSVIQSI